MVRLQGIAFPVSHRWSRCRVTLTYMRSSSPIRSGGGGPYRTVRTRCESGVRIKIPESGSRCIRIQFGMLADLDHVRIWNHLHFAVLLKFFTDPDPRIRIQVRVTPNSFRQILNMNFLKENSDPCLPLDGSVHVFTILALKKMRYPVWGLRRGSGPRSGSARPPSHRYRSKVRYHTAMDYGPSICIRVHIPYRTVRIRILILHWLIKIKLLGAWIQVQYSDPDLPGLVRIIRASHSNDVRCPRWKGQSRKTTTVPKSGLKIKIYLKIKVFASSGSQRIQICGLRIRDSDSDLNQDPLLTLTFFY